MKLTLKIARAHLRNLGMELIALKGTGKDYRPLRLSDAERENYANALATVDAELSRYERVVELVTREHAAIGEVLSAVEEKTDVHPYATRDKG